MSRFILQLKARLKSLLRRHWCLLITCSLCIILGITLYDTSNQAANWGPEPVDGSSLRVELSQIKTDNLWRTAQANSLRGVLISNGMDFIYHEPENFPAQWQLGDIHRPTREGTGYLVIVPTDLSAPTPALRGVKDTGVPIIPVDQLAETIDQSYYVSLISADYLKEGQICVGPLADKFVDQPCSIVEIYGTESSPGAQTHSEGFHQALMQYPNMEIIDVEYGNSDRVTVQKTMGNALIKIADRGRTIDAVLTHSDEDGLGVPQAIKAAGLPSGRISIMSINGIQDVCKAIITGKYLGTVESNPR